MKQKRKKVLCIDSDSSFLHQQEEVLNSKELDKYFFPFNDFREALHFIEKQIIAKNKNLHYILLDEKISGAKLPSTLEKISELKSFLKKPEVIVCTNNNTEKLRNQVMQFPVVSAFLEKPIPKNYIEFLITGSSV